MDIIKILQEELGIRRGQVETTIKLIDEGNTIPFIARYRKEMTGSLDDETLRNFHERLLYLRNLEERKEAIKKNIEEQGKLTKELAKQIEEAKTLVAVEDLYRPYKQKKRTRAMIVCAGISVLTINFINSVDSFTNDKRAIRERSRSVYQ